MVFMLSIPLLISPAAAWSIQTHQTIATKVYYSLPVPVEQKLDLNEMIRGSVAPDVVFKDNNPNHQYPASVKQTQNWLNKGKAAYNSKNYRYASYCFGVASHYITDTYSAPHTVAGETSKQHAAYENQGTGMTPSIRYMSGSLNSIMSYGYKQGQPDWKLWLKTKNRSILQKDLNNAGSAAFTLIRRCV